MNPSCVSWFFRVWCFLSGSLVVISIVHVAQVVAQNLLTNFEIQHGYVYPPSVTVAEGEVIHLRLLVPMQEGDRCLYREPGSPTDIDVHGNDPLPVKARRNVQRVKLPRRIDELDCGIRVNPVHQRDAGFWRLTLVRGTERIRGVAMVDVIERPVVPEVGIDGTGGGSVSSLNEISPERTEYCFVRRQGPSGTSSMAQGAGSVPMYEHCQLPLSDTDPTGAGVWSVIAGVQGQMREMTYGIHIENKEERIVTDVHKDLDYHVLSCNLLNTKLMLKFCRFERLADGFGLNVIPGIGTTRYGYLGSGFERNECGLEILNPDGLDKGTWKCLLGYGDDSITKVSGAVVDNSDKSPPLSIIGLDDMVTALNGSTTSLLCNANKPIDYCWFRGPQGQFFSLSERLTEAHNDGHYWYSGISLTMGECGITFSAISEAEHAGQWHCYVGNGHISALEVSAIFQLRISTSQMISQVDQVEATVDFPALLGCDSIPRGTPLQYCRFVTPTGLAFSLNENVTTDRPVLERFYSNPNHDLAKGSCSLVIASVHADDFGQWICAGKIEGHPTEHIFSITLHDRNENLAPNEPSGESLSAASISGMVIGAIAVFAGAIGVGYWQLRKRMHRQAAAVNEQIQMQRMESSSPVEQARLRQSISMISTGSDASSTESPQNTRKYQTSF